MIAPSVETFIERLGIRHGTRSGIRFLESDKHAKDGLLRFKDAKKEQRL